MLFLPIVERELRVASRSRRTYLTRLAAGLAALATAFYLIWLAGHALGGVIAGMFILKSATYLAWGLCVFGGVNRTCDAVSAERRADTLGLLFLTRLKGYDIVLGKLLAHGLGSLYLLLGVLPVLSVPVLLGGVAGTEMVRIPVALLNTLLFSLSIGLLVSCLVASHRAAAAISGTLIVCVAVFLPLAAQMAERDWQNPALARWLRAPSPLSAQEMAFASAFGLSNNDFWKAILLQFSMAASALAAACLLLPNSWKQRAPAGPGWLQKGQARLRDWTLGDAASRLKRRRRLLAENPWYWLCARDRLAPFVAPALAVLTFSATGWCIFHYEVPKPPACALLLATAALNDLVNRMRVASLSSSRLAEDRQSGALEMLLSTELTVPEILRGQWKAVRRAQLPNYCGLLLLYLILAAIALNETSPAFESWFLAITFALISAGDFLVLGYVAMWKGMRVSQPRQAAGLALFRVSLLPLLIWLGCLPLIEGIQAIHIPFELGSPYTYLGAAMFFWGTSALTAFMQARRNLARHFREAATDRYTLEQRLRLFARGARRRRTQEGALPARGSNPPFSSSV